jgi:hypothetical protein
MTTEQHAHDQMTRISRIVEHQGRTYRVSTDEALRTAPLHSYARVWRIRKDGTTGERITTGSIVYAVVNSVEPFNDEG